MTSGCTKLQKRGKKHLFLARTKETKRLNYYSKSKSSSLGIYYKPQSTFQGSQVITQIAVWLVYQRDLVGERFVLSALYWRKRRHATHAKVCFFWWVGWNGIPSNWCLHFCKRKEPLLSKDCNENIDQWRAKKPSNLSKINSDTRALWSIAILVWIIVGKKEMHWCHAFCSLIPPLHSVLRCVTRPSNGLFAD